MIRIIAIIAGLLVLNLIPGTAKSQTPASTGVQQKSMVVKKNAPGNKTGLGKDSLSIFVKNQFAVDSSGKKEQGKNINGTRYAGRRKDKFIDRNGDGICDGRESAIGLKKMYRMRRGGRK